MRRWLGCLLLWVAVLPAGTYAQLSKADESRLYAETKQLNQFMLRFNGEEDQKGKRLYEGNKHWRDRALRRKYIPMLFDQSKDWDKALLNRFLDTATGRQSPFYLNLHKPGLMAEVHSTFMHEGKKVRGRLLMRLEEEAVGSRWVIDEVWLPSLAAYVPKDTSGAGFLHPLSHELAFMNMRKVLLPQENPYSYVDSDYEIDQLSLFAYELQKGNLQFLQVDELRFHFFISEGWYMEMAYQNRPGYNRGWLVVNLVEVPAATMQAHLRKQLFSMP